MWCSEITTITCPTDIPTGGNREEFGGSPRSHWQIEIKMKLLVWSVSSYLCQDKGSSNTSLCGWDGGENNNYSTAPNTPSMDSTMLRGSPGQRPVQPLCPSILQFSFPQRTANPLWTMGTKSLEPQRRRNVGCPKRPLQGSIPLRAQCSLCSLQLTAEPRLHSGTWTEWEHLGQSFFSYSISWGYSWVRLSGLHSHCSARNRCSFSLRKITHK